MMPFSRRVVVIGSSAGAVDALSAILPELSAGYPIPMLMVVHLQVNRKSMLAELLQSKCQLKVQEAEDKDQIESGVIYLAPPDYHLLVETDGTISLSTEEPVSYCRPSIDVLFASAADAYGPSLTGIILSGANTDGADGLRAVIDAGGVGLVQRPELAHVATMPQAAIDACPEAHRMTLIEITRYLQGLANAA